MIKREKINKIKINIIIKKNNNSNNNNNNNNNNNKISINIKSNNNKKILPYHYNTQNYLNSLNDYHHNYVYKNQ
jgi:hypothetical protein